MAETSLQNNKEQSSKIIEWILEYLCSEGLDDCASIFMEASGIELRECEKNTKMRFLLCGLKLHLQPQGNKISLKLKEAPRFFFEVQDLLEKLLKLDPENVHQLITAVSDFIQASGLTREDIVEFGNDPSKIARLDKKSIQKILLDLDTYRKKVGSGLSQPKLVELVEIESKQREKIESLQQEVRKLQAMVTDLSGHAKPIVSKHTKAAALDLSSTEIDVDGERLDSASLATVDGSRKRSFLESVIALYPEGFSEFNKALEAYKLSKHDWEDKISKRFIVTGRVNDKEKEMLKNAASLIKEIPDPLEASLKAIPSHPTSDVIELNANDNMLEVGNNEEVSTIDDSLINDPKFDIHYDHKKFPAISPRAPKAQRAHADSIRKSSGKGPKKKPFSDDEVDNLMRGVAKFGEGQWSKILHSYLFQPFRNSIDLRDKWRNMEKAKNK